MNNWNEDKKNIDELMIEAMKPNASWVYMAEVQRILRKYFPKKTKSQQRQLLTKEIF